MDKLVLQTETPNPYGGRKGNSHKRQLQSHPAVPDLALPDSSMSRMNFYELYFFTPQLNLLSRITRCPGRILRTLAIRDNGVRLYTTGQLLHCKAPDSSLYASRTALIRISLFYCSVVPYLTPSLHLCTGQGIKRNPERREGKKKKKKEEKDVIQDPQGSNYPAARLE